MLTLAPYLSWLGTWWGRTIELLGAVLLFIWATRLEQDRENESRSLIYVPGGSSEGKIGLPPAKPKRHWFWARLGASTLVLGSLTLGLIFVVNKRKNPETVAHFTPAASPPAAQKQTSRPSDTSAANKSTKQSEMQKRSAPASSPTGQNQTQEHPDHKIGPNPGAAQPTQAAPQRTRNQPMIPGTYDSAYSEVDEALGSVSDLNSQWKGGILQQKDAKQHPDPDLTPQQIHDNYDMAIATLNASIGYEWNPIENRVRKAFADALTRMEMPGPRQLSPNEIAAETQKFTVIIATTRKGLSILDIQNDKLNERRFDQLQEYLTNLHTRLGDYSEIPKPQ
jgi:hypothetical protein